MSNNSNNEGKSMHAGTATPLKTGLLAACAALAMLAFGPTASATVVRINFSGAAGSGYADLTIASDPNASSSYTPSSRTDNKLSQYDPAGASLIISATGSFNGMAITGVAPSSYAAYPNSSSTPPPMGTGYENLPRSFTWLTPGADSFDNLFYPGGSPLVCPPNGSPPYYVFHGGFLDIFGVMFELDNGTDGYVGLWSDGVLPPGFQVPPQQAWTGGLTFGLSVVAPDYSTTSFQFYGVVANVPEPSFFWLFGAGLLGLFGWRRSLESRKARRTA